MTEYTDEDIDDITKALEGEVIPFETLAKELSDATTLAMNSTTNMLSKRLRDRNLPGKGLTPLQVEVFADEARRRIRDIEKQKASSKDNQETIEF